MLSAAKRRVLRKKGDSKIVKLIKIKTR